VYQDGSYETVQPLLVSGYDVAVDAPASVGSDGSAEVTVDLTATAASADPANVQVIVAQGDTTETFDASGGGGEYTATIDGGALEEGDYTVYAVAQGDEEAFGRSELLGLSDGHSLAVEAESGSSGGDGGSGGDGTDGSESTDETETTDGDDAADADGSDDDGSSDGAANPPANETTDTETTTEPPTTTVAMTETATDTDDSVVTPANDTETGDGSHGPGRARVHRRRCAGGARAGRPAGSATTVGERRRSSGERMRKMVELGRSGSGQFGPCSMLSPAAAGISYLNPVRYRSVRSVRSVRSRRRGSR